MGGSSSSSPASTVLASVEAAGGATDPKLNPELAVELPNENPGLDESPALLEDDPKENPVLDLSADPKVGKVLEADLLVSADESPKLNPDEGFLSSVFGFEPNEKGVELSEALESDFAPKVNPLDSFLSEVDDPKLNPAKT